MSDVRSEVLSYDLSTYYGMERQVRGDSHHGKSWNYGERVGGDGSAMPSTYDEGGGRAAPGGN